MSQQIGGLRCRSIGALMRPCCAAAPSTRPPPPPPLSPPLAARRHTRFAQPQQHQQQQQPQRRASHVCQAHPRRVAKVASQIQRELSEMLVRDDALARAVCPDRGAGGALTAVAGVTHVYVSNDLQVVKAYVSVYSDARGKQQAMANLKRLEPYVRSQIGRRVPLRLTPEVRFEYDDSVEEAELVQQVLGPEEYERLSRLAAGEAEGAAAAAAASNAAALGVGEDGAGGGDEDGGFFDLGDGGEAEEEYEDDDEEEAEYRGRWFDQPGPFDDLFGGGGGGGGSGGSGGRGGGGRNNNNKQQQQKGKSRRR